MDKQTYSVAEVAQKLGLSTNSVYAGIHDGSIPSIKIGRRLLVPIPALDRMLGSGGDNPTEHKDKLTQRPPCAHRWHRNE